MANPHTQVPNYFFDHMADMQSCEQGVVLCIIRKTFGYQKEWDEISFSQFEEATGLNRPSVRKGIQLALQRGIIQRQQFKNSFQYCVCDPALNGSKNEPISEDEVIEIGSESEPKIGSQIELIDTNGSKNEPKSVQKMNTQKKKENTFPKGKVRALESAAPSGIDPPPRRKPKSTAYVNLDTGISTNDIFDAWKKELDQAEPGAVVNYGQEKAAAKKLAKAGKLPEHVVTAFWKMKKERQYYRDSHLSLTVIATHIAAVLNGSEAVKQSPNGSQSTYKRLKQL